MSNLAQKRLILEPSLHQKSIIYVLQDSLRPNEHSGTKKFCKIFLNYKYLFDSCALCKSKIQLLHGSFLPYHTKKISFLLLQRNYKEGKLQFHELQKYVNVFSFLDTLRTNFEKFSTPYSLKHQFYLQFCLQAAKSTRKLAKTFGW